MVTLVLAFVAGAVVAVVFPKVGAWVLKQFKSVEKKV